MDYEYGNSQMGVVGWILYIVLIVFYLFCLWRIFVKAGKPGWAAIVPIYNIIVELEIVGKPWYWLLLMLVPVVDVVLGIIVIFRLSKVFGHGTGFGFGLLFLPFIFLPILAFDRSSYLGPTVE
jgi:ABC-type sulfate transport system permease subunit